MMKESGELELTGAYKRVFNSPDGQLVLNDLMNSTTFYNAVFEPEKVQYNEGARGVVLRIFRHMHIDAELLKERIKEDAMAARENFI